MNQPTAAPPFDLPPMEAGSVDELPSNGGWQYEPKYDGFRCLRIGPAALPFTDETYVAAGFTPEGVGLRPLSVVHVEQPWRKARSPGDLTIRWTRRSRALVADSWTGTEVPLAEETEAYEVEILDGGVVKRRLMGGTTSVTYTSAQQIADWGGLLGPGDSLAIRIFQLSALIRRGAGQITTLTF